MTRTIIASAALFAAHALAAGNAIVVNSCSYDVHLANTPASGGGYSAIDQVLSSGGSYEQQWTELSNTMGWSIKLSKSDSMDNILQYEYTFHNDGTIWYDLSAVNGNPWDSDYEITATSGCTPRQAAYRYSTDDAFGMQDCPDSATITVTLCTGKSAGGSGSSAPAPSSPAETSYPTSAAPVPSSPVSPSPTPSPTSTKTEGGHGHGGHHTWSYGNKEAAAPVESKKSPTPTTLATVADSDSWDGPAVTVTNVAMQTVTQYVTATAEPQKRHEHHPRHPHHRV